MGFELDELLGDDAICKTSTLGVLQRKEVSTGTKEVSHAYNLKKIDKELPKIIKNINDDLPDGSSLVLAGGAISSLFNKKPINDYDIYLVTDVTDDDKYSDLLSDIIDDLGSNTRFVSCSDKSILVAWNDFLINFVFFKKFHKVEDIFEGFDFSCVMGSYHLTDKKFYVTEDFLIDNISRVIRFNHKTAFPIMSLLRVKKYVDKGYEISRNEMLKICLRVSQLNIKSFKVLKKHIGGMYGIDIESLFDTTKKFNMTEVIDQINELDFDYDTSVDIERNYSAFHALKLSLMCKNCKLTYVEFKDAYLLIKNGELMGIVNKNLIEDENITLYKHSGKFKVYKYVMFKDGGLVSHREQDFVYKLGETLHPKTTSTGLFCGSLNQKKNFTYSGYSNSVLIELLVDPKDLINISSYEKSSTKMGVSNMEVKKFVFTKVLELPEGAKLDVFDYEK